MSDSKSGNPVCKPKYQPGPIPNFPRVARQHQWHASPDRLRMPERGKTESTLAHRLGGGQSSEERQVSSGQCQTPFCLANPSARADNFFVYLGLDSHPKQVRYRAAPRSELHSKISLYPLPYQNDTVPVPPPRDSRVPSRFETSIPTVSLAGGVT